MSPGGAPRSESLLGQPHHLFRSECPSVRPSVHPCIHPCICQSVSPSAHGCARARTRACVRAGGRACGWDSGLGVEGGLACGRARGYVQILEHYNLSAVPVWIVCQPRTAASVLVTNLTSSLVHAKVHAGADAFEAFCTLRRHVKMRLWNEHHSPPQCVHFSLP